MNKTFKKLILITTGLVVGVVVGRVKRKSNLLEVKITDLDVYKKHLKETQDQLTKIRNSIVY